MHKKAIDSSLSELYDLQVKIGQRLKDEQERDASAVRADIEDINDRVNALEAKRDSMLKVLEATHKDQVTAIHDTFNAMLKFETERKEALTGRLASMTGEEKKTNTKKRARKIQTGENPNHVLFKTGDKDAPDIIKDRNGEVVLGLCKICGKGEVELEGPCVP